MTFDESAARIWNKDASMDVVSLHWNFDNITQPQPRPSTNSLPPAKHAPWLYFQCTTNLIIIIIIIIIINYIIIIIIVISVVVVIVIVINIHSKYFADSVWLKALGLFFITKSIGINQVWKTRAIYHRFDGISTLKQGWSMVYLPGNDAARAIDYRSICFPGAAAYREV